VFAARRDLQTSPQLTQNNFAACPRARIARTEPRAWRISACADAIHQQRKRARVRDSAEQTHTMATMSFHSGCCSSTARTVVSAASAPPRRQLAALARGCTPNGRVTFAADVLDVLNLCARAWASQRLLCVRTCVRPRGGRGHHSLFSRALFLASSTALSTISSPTTCFTARSRPCRHRESAQSPHPCSRSTVRLCPSRSTHLCTRSRARKGAMTRNVCERVREGRAELTQQDAVLREIGPACGLRVQQLRETGE
jgi:hypothetical protein